MNIQTTTATAEEASVLLQEKPGVRLSRVREELGLTQEEVSIQLHLPIVFLVALEEDNIEKLPGLTFVRGYLRLYAKLLGVSPDEIIDSFNVFYPDTHEKAPAPDSNYQRIVIKPKRRHDSSVKWIGYIIVVVMVALVVMWWQSRNSSSNILNSHTMTGSSFQAPSANGAAGSSSAVTSNLSLPAGDSPSAMPGAASATPMVGTSVNSQTQMTVTNPIAGTVANTVSNVPGLQSDNNLAPAMAGQAAQKSVDIVQTTANAAAVPGLTPSPQEMTVAHNSSSVVKNTQAQSPQISAWRDPDTNN